MVNEFGERDGMTLRVLGLCRGEGKGYVKICVKDCHAGLRAAAVLKDGESFDCPIISIGFPGEDEIARKNWGDDSYSGKREFVVVVPLLDKAKYDVRVEDDFTHEEVGTFSFCSLSSKIKSRLTYRERPEFAFQIRDIELRRTSGMPQMCVEGIFPIGDGRYSCRFRICHPYSGVSGTCSISVYDEAARRIDVRPILLKDTLVPDPHDSACTIHEALYSVIVSETKKTLCIAAKLEDGDSCFACILPPMFDHFVQLAYERVRHASCDESYQQWFERNRATYADIRSQRRICQSWADDQKPLISIVTVIFHPPVAYLQALIKSLIAQSYDNFEVVFVNVSGDENGAEATNKVLSSLNDPRFHVIIKENGSIADNTNAGINETRGDYIAFVDHDDVVEPDALYRYVSALHDNPTADVLYCDEDLLDEGRYRWPTFKPAYNPDLLNAHNYVTHMLMVSRTVLEQVELSPSDVSGAQDYDLTLKCCEKARTVVNVQSILYHWRVHRNSTSANPDSKPYAQIAGKLALERHFDRIGLPVKVKDAELPFSYRPQYIDAGVRPKVSIVVPCQKDDGALGKCLVSILSKTEYENYDICVVGDDDFWSNGTYDDEAWTHDSRIKTVIFHGDEAGRASLYNYGAALCDGALLLFLDSGVSVINEKWLDSMASFFLRPDVGIVGAKLLSPDGLVKHGGMWVSAEDAGFLGGLLPDGEGGYMETMRYPVDCSAVSSACLMIRRPVFTEIGGFEEKLNGMLGSADLCLKAGEKQFLTVFDPQARLYWWTNKREFEVRDGHDKCTFDERAYFHKRWCKRLNQDCYINRNLNPYDDGHYKLA